MRRRAGILSGIIQQERQRIFTGNSSTECNGNDCGRFSVSKNNVKISPEYLIMCGIAAGLGPESEQMYGDVMIPDTVWNCSSGKFTVPKDPAISFGEVGFLPRPVSLSLDSSLLEIVKSLKGHCEFELNIGPMACGASVVANREFIEKRILSFMPGTIGLDMESYGVFYAAENAPDPKPKAIVIKGICDYADAKKRQVSEIRGL